ncbi:MAG: phosphatidate cytidylyltransferase, partial [Treponema sp.]|nr:phosphatidate cytidylyltransferase [Treponema sp.]
GKTRPYFLHGKSLEGSIACFTAVFISAFFICQSCIASLTVAFTASVTEALPLEDYDNIALPLTVGLVASWFIK